MSIFIDEHIHPDKNHEVRVKTFDLIDSKNEQFMKDLTEMLSVEDVVGINIGEVLIDTLENY